MKLHLVLLGCVLLCMAPFSARAQFIIMPLGDSITWGFNGSVVSPATPGGYRGYLYDELVEDGYSVTYVGSSNENPSPTLTSAGQTAHNGYNGYRLDQIAANLDGSLPLPNSNHGGNWLTSGPQTANVILLHIGTNDIYQGYDPIFNPGSPTSTSGESADLFGLHLSMRLGNLIDTIQLYEPDATLLVAGIIPLTLNATLNNRVIAYNSHVQDLISTTYSDDNVHYVDMYGAFLNGMGNPDPSLRVDTVHPTTTGYQLMAQTWADAVEEDVILPSAISAPEPSSILLLALGAVGLAVFRRKSSLQKFR